MRDGVTGGESGGESGWIAGRDGGGGPAALAKAGLRPPSPKPEAGDGVSWRERYSRQIRFAPIGEAGQLRLREASVLIAGCGALGASLAQHMARAGVGRLVIVDRDYVELSNLHRQTLFDEEDARRVMPKAKAAEEKLRRLNGETAVEAHVADMGPANIGGYAADVDLILDGTDNAATRLLLCDEAFRRGIPFLYGGVTASRGMSATLVPGKTACLACLIGGEDEAGEGDTCDVSGVLSATVEFVAALQAAEAVKWLSGNREAVRGTWASADIWHFAVREYELPSGVEACARCGTEARTAEAGPRSRHAGMIPSHDRDRERDRKGQDSAAGGGLEAEQRGRGARSTALCGRDTVQVTLGMPLDLERESRYLERMGCGIVVNPYLAKAELPSPRAEKLVLFPDGRVLVQGTSDAAEAERLCDAYLGRGPLESRRGGTAG